ncbi:MAG: 4Fe-4S dicluster domain-containing protein [Deltaproteobacteria bacterium]
MITKVFSKKDWVKVLESLKEDFKVFVPVKDGDFHYFRLLENDRKPSFDFQNTRLSPKSVIFPQSERMFEYSLDKGEEDAYVLKEAQKEFPLQLIAGIRPCDAFAFQLVRINFDNPQYQDPWWVRRMEATTLMGLGCNEPCASCFCTSVGSGPFDDKGLDALMYDLGDRFMVRSVTFKGKALLEKMRLGRDAEDATVRKALDLPKAAEKKISSKVPTDQLKEKNVNGLFNAPFWEKVSFSCINCGTCTYLCPTCWCFDIQDEVLGKEGDRIRNWDACMFSLFTLHGSGHNPRDKKFQRVRQRFMHKLKYYVDKYGNGVACVGCGRCVQFCPVNIDIREVAELMNNY